MPSRSSIGSNVQNRSPWRVQARSKPHLDKQFAFNRQQDAEAYLRSLVTQGLKAKLIQLETSFQLRLRRQGARVQFITFDTREEAEQARLKIESELSVSIIRDYQRAANPARIAAASGAQAASATCYKINISWGVPLARLYQLSEDGGEEGGRKEDSGVCQA